MKVHTRTSCPWCGGTENIYSVYRDGGSTLYHSGCEAYPNSGTSQRWKSKEWLENRKPIDWEKLAKAMMGESGQAEAPTSTHGYGLFQITSLPIRVEEIKSDHQTPEIPITYTKEIKMQPRRDREPTNGIIIGVGIVVFLLSAAAYGLARYA